MQLGASSSVLGFPARARCPGYQAQLRFASSQQYLWKKLPVKNLILPPPRWGRGGVGVLSLLALAKYFLYADR
jgi:hypothetical protein